MVKLFFIKWFMILLIWVVKIQSTFDNLHAYPYSHHPFVSKACPIWLDLMWKINQISQHNWFWEGWLLCLFCLPGVSWLLCGSSSRCNGIVCSLWLWYFLIILTYYFSNAKSIWTINIPHIVSPIVTQFYQKLKHFIFMKMKVELYQSIFFFYQNWIG